MSISKSLYQSKIKIIVTLCLIFSSLSIAAQENRAACYNQCVTDYGNVLGVTKSGVKSYSNCNNDCVIFEAGRHDGTYTGIKWQCVEFARRWLLINHGVVYGDVDYAIDIWDKIKTYTNIKTKKTVAVSSIINGSKTMPVKGDLLIYAKALLGTGHVAVVVNVDKELKRIRIAEQNYKNEKWKNSHARSIEYVIKNGHYWLLDEYLVGWKHAEL